MACKYAHQTDEFHGWECEITGGACAFLLPNSKLCDQIYGDGESDTNSAETDGTWTDGNGSASLNWHLPPPWNYANTALAGVAALSMPYLSGFDGGCSGINK